MFAWSQPPCQHPRFKSRLANKVRHLLLPSCCLTHRLMTLWHRPAACLVVTWHSLWTFRLATPSTRTQFRSQVAQQFLQQWSLVARLLALLVVHLHHTMQAPWVMQRTQATSRQHPSRTLLRFWLVRTFHALATHTCASFTHRRAVRSVTGLNSLK